MKIIKRDKSVVNMSFNKINHRIKNLCNDRSLGTLKTIDPDVICQRVVSSIYDGITSVELDEEAARIAIGMTENMEYAKLASRIIISNMHKNTKVSFSEVMEDLYNNAIDYSRDYLFDYFGFKTLEKSYLMKIMNKETNKMVVVERPQHLYMRVAVGIHKEDINSALKTYELISQHYYTHASPTLFNAGTRLSNLSSCFEENTIVTTVNRGPIKIKDVKVGDSVVTHLGNIKEVKQIHKNLLNNRKLYDINIVKTEKIKVTENHKLWTIKKGSNKPEWSSVENLEKGDYIGIPNKNAKVDYITELDIYKFKEMIENKNDRKCSYTLELENDKVTMKTHWEHCGWQNNQGVVKCSRKHSSINKIWKINENFAKFVGIFYGDGHIISGKDSNGDLVIRGIGITIHSKNDKLINFCSNVGMDIFGIKSSVHNMKNQNVTQVLFNSNIVGEIFNEFFGRHFNNKKIWNEMYKWDKNLVVSLLEGLITTDGCISSKNHLLLQMSNVKFMRQLYYLLRNNNIDTSYGKEKRASKGTTNHVQMNIPLYEINKENVNKYYEDNRMDEYKPICRNQYSPKIIDGFKFLKFESKNAILENLPEYVYTLGVEDDHSYNVGGIIAENCFLQGTEDSLDGIYKTITDCARISKVGGGIGVHVSNIRAKGSVIRGTNGKSDGIIPMIKVYNETARYINQSGKRKGSFAIYLEPWHADIIEFLDLKKNQGHEDMRARDLFYAMWMPDLFMMQVEKDGDWYLMCPDECPGLTDAYGDDFEALYWKYVDEKKYKRVIKAQEIWMKILDSQIETGTPYIGYKDSVNKKCNQKNLGTIKSSNLCIEVSIHSDNENYGVCNLASIALPKYVKYDNKKRPYFDYEHLLEVSKYIVHPMNKVIDNNYYPIPETSKTNSRDRPLGIGVQGLHDVYIKMRIPFESKEAKELNKLIFETIYYGLLQGSIDESKKDGPYQSFKGSPFSEGKLQFDLAAEFDNIDLKDYLSDRYDWDSLKQDLVKYGARNSLLTALMPTASSAQIMGNSEAFEPVDSCIFKRRVLSGEYIVVNKYLVEDLTKLNLWDRTMKDTIIANNGSIQGISSIPEDIRALYKTVWEISMKSVIEQCADRQKFVDQMMSMNLFMANPNYKRLTSMHFYAWKNNLKSGIYYLRSKGSYQSGKFSVDANLEKSLRDAKKQEPTEEEILACSRENPEACMLCTS